MTGGGWEGRGGEGPRRRIRREHGRCQAWHGHDLCHVPSFLVEKERAGDFTAAVEALGRDHGHLTLQVHGPLPPYSFVE
ncbi:GvpL/GvpF family gas vesicle protein [Streptomyces fradiae]|uniref:GvpL/GvpF family gas vesicle protein n=1 Tax=Streptomyces fradiae TaxID=1906 RepID=UPI00342611A5